MKFVARFLLVLLVVGVLAVLIGGGYVFFRGGEQPPAPVMVHHELTPHIAPEAPAKNMGASLPDLPPVGTAH